VSDRDYDCGRRALHVDGLAFFGDVATAMADKIERLYEAERQKDIAEWRAFMRTAPDEQEISPPLPADPFNGARLSSKGA
jgi:hypothetical protein